MAREGSASQWRGSRCATHWEEGGSDTDVQGRVLWLLSFRELEGCRAVKQGEQRCSWQEVQRQEITETLHLSHNKRLVRRCSSITIILASETVGYT